MLFKAIATAAALTVVATEALGSGSMLPPARYDHPPSQRMQVLEGTQPEIQRVCRLASKYRGGREILACALPGKSVCIMVWPKGKARSGALWRHERAHCNGWRH